MTASQNMKNRITIQSNYFTSGYLSPNALKAGTQPDICSPIFTEALSVATVKEPPRCPPTGERVNRMWSVHTCKIIQPKQEGLSDTCCSRDEPQGHYDK